MATVQYGDTALLNSEPLTYPSPTRGLLIYIPHGHDGNQTASRAGRGKNCVGHATQCYETKSLPHRLVMYQTLIDPNGTSLLELPCTQPMFHWMDRHSRRLIGNTGSPLLEGYRTGRTPGTKPGRRQWLAEPPKSDRGPPGRKKEVLQDRDNSLCELHQELSPMRGSNPQP